jgi:hypothetical protein
MEIQKWIQKNEPNFYIFPEDVFILFKSFFLTGSLDNFRMQETLYWLPFQAIQIYLYILWLSFTFLWSLVIFLISLYRVVTKSTSFVMYLLCYVCIAGAILDAKLLARSQYSGGPATGHLDTSFSWFPVVYKQMLRWLLCFQVATTCFLCSPPDLKLNVSVTSFIFLLHVKWPLPPGDSPIAVYYYYYYYYYYYFHMYSG